MNDNKRIEACRSCGSPDLTDLFSLGEQFVSTFVDHACQACDGDGSLSNQWAKEECVKSGGHSLILPPDHPSAGRRVYYTGEGKEIEFKLIGGRCRACGGAKINFRGDGPNGPPVKCPIEVVLCRACTLVQQRWTAPSEFMYTRHYWYRSGVTQTMRTHLAELALEAVKRADLRPGDVVLDIGSNDGTLLLAFKQRAPECVTVGVEPATNMQSIGMSGLDLYISDFWNVQTYFDAIEVHLNRKRFDKQAKLITAIGMLYDLDDPNQFIADVATALAPGGTFVAQLMMLEDMMATNDVGNLCHEHLEFYSVWSMMQLLDRHGLEIFDLERNGINGRSTRLWCRHKSGDKMSKKVVEEMGESDYRFIDMPITLKEWFRRLSENRDRCVDFIHREVAAGKRVWVYGASTKGNVILQWYDLCGFCQLGKPPTIFAAADRSPEKWGKVTVGTGILIDCEEVFRTDAPDYALVLPYGFIDEFVVRERAWLEGGGKFIVPLPEFRIIGKEALK